MGIKKFMYNVKELLGLDEFKKSGKKKSVKRLLKQLKFRKEILEHTPTKKLNKREKRELKEELSIITLQIKKGKKILNELNHAQDDKNLKNKKEK